MLLVPYLQIRANSIYSFTINEDRNYHRSIQSALTENLLKQKTYSGKLCPGAKKRLIKAIEFMVQSSPHRTIFNPVTHRNQSFKLSFMTLTIHSTSRNIKGKEAFKTMLEPFLQWLRRNHGVNTYLWKAELQKRGQIHYHLTLNQFVHWKSVRDKWNELQKKAGYLDNFYNKYGHWSPNSIDVHSTKAVRNMSGYLVKEIAKSFQNENSVGGKIWDCSMNLKACKYFSVNDNMDYSFVNQMVKDNRMRVLETDHCYIYEFLNDSPTMILNETNLLEYNRYIESIRTMEFRQKELVKQIEKVLYNYIPITVQAKADKTIRLFDQWRIGVCEIDLSPGCFSSS